MPGVQARRCFISASSRGSSSAVSRVMLSHTPSTRTSGSRSRSTTRMFFTSWRMKFLRTGRLLMVISGKTLMMSFMSGKRGAGNAKEKGEYDT